MSAQADGKVAVTAGLRGASWNAQRMAAPYTVTPCPLPTGDGQKVLGFLFARGGERSAAFLMHPREMVVTHYLVPDVLDAGWACWVQGPRSIGNDLRLEHEIALHDVAAGMRHLRELGFGRIAMIGNSGGAGLFTFYNQQALLAPEQRIARTPGGRPTGLQAATLPAPDALALVSPHPGQGILLMNGLDPSLTDENDPLSVDAALDPFDPANGFRRPPESSSYAASFIERYRAAQRERCARIDAHARELLQRRGAARQRLKQAPTRDDKRIASHAPIFTVWRTDADLRCWDTSLDPSDRLVGSLWGADPAVSNLGSVGFGRVVTPESWLSTWSGLSSNASLANCAPAVEQPVLLLEYTGDNCVFPSDLDRIYADLRSTRKQRHRVRGNHHGMPLAAGEPAGQIEAGRLIQAWLNDSTGG
ncbi:MAG: alpha/beta hydrolase [Burkholderiaceae bacterium]